MTSEVKNSYPETIVEMIAQAHHAAKNGDMEAAVRTFDLCRAKVLTLTPPNKLKKKLDADAALHWKEAERVRAGYLKRAPLLGGTKIAIFGDSLGLPRPPEFSDPDCLDKAYAGIIRARLEDSTHGKPRVDSHCQRYFSTDALVDLLPERTKSLKDAHVLIHLGLNDCFARIFMTDQRLALDLLPKETSASILDFAREYRHPLIIAYPNHKYVPLPRFIANLHKAAAMCHAAGALSITFSTITMIPMKFWHDTPQLSRNFTAYNLAIMDVAAETNAHVLDVDRLMWTGDTAKTLNPDGMHLSHEGHKILADTWLKERFGI